MTQNVWVVHRADGTNVDTFRTELDARIYASIIRELDGRPYWVVAAWKGWT